MDKGGYDSSSWPVGEENVQGELDSVERNRSIYEKISSKLFEQGHNYSWKLCGTKIKNLTQRYRKVQNK